MARDKETPETSKSRTHWMQVGLLAAVCAALALAPQSSLGVSLTKVQDLEFGSLVGGYGSGGTVTIDASGNRHASGNVRPIGAGFTPARFALKGSPNETYTLYLPSSLVIYSGGDQMEVSALTCSIPLTGRIPPNGSLTVSLGATLQVKAAQRSSRYLGVVNLVAKN